ncbi:MAG: hypothetical protein MJA29_14250, partial [Candidatus Omnitrophica bacterium]|nr:hypothetical protein [Candidatus Omnitrophota bacterium]
MYRKIFSWIIIAAFIGNSVIPAWAQPVESPGYQQILHGLPGHRQILEITEKFQPPVLRGISVDPENPFRVEFMLDEAEALLSDEEIKQEAERLSKYFLAGLAVPRDELWVNLSPYEADEVVPDELGRTDLGKDLLAEDYVLKQLLASLMHPESEAGKAFWAKVYTRAEALYGTSEIPVETCNKVWVVPKKAVVYENGNEAVITESSLEVLLDEDYLAMSEQGVSGAEGMQSFASEVAREVIVPLLEQEVNEGEHFGVLRQIYHSLILAAWYKHRLTESVLSRAYADKKKVEGIELSEAGVKERIYGQYVKAFEEGAYDLVKTEYDLQKGVSVSRRYVSGGMNLYGLAAYGSPGGVIAFKEDVTRAVIDQVASGTTRGAMDFLPPDGSSSSAVTLEEAKARLIAIEQLMGETIAELGFNNREITQAVK